MSARGQGVLAHGVLYVIGTALQGVGVLAVTPFATRLLGPAQYGGVAVGLIAVQIVGTVAAAGLPQVILREHHEPDGGPERARALSGAMLLLALAAAVVVAAIALPVALVVSGARSAVGAVVLVAVASAGLTGVVAGQALLRAARRPLAFVVVALASTAGAQAAGLAASAERPRASSFLLGYAAALLVSAAVGALLARPARPWRRWAAVRSGLATSAPLLPHGVALLVLLMGDVLVVRVLLGAADAGRYQVALVLGNIPFVVATALYNAWGPLVMQRPATERWDWAAGTVAPLTGVIAAGSAGVALLAPWLLAVVAPASFDHDALLPVVAALVLVAPTYMPYQVASLAVLDAGRPGRLALCGIGAAAVQVVGVAGGAVAGGLAGAAGARWVAYAVLLVTVAVVARATPGLHLASPALALVILGAVAASVAGAVLGGAALPRVALAAVAAVAGVLSLLRARQVLTRPSSLRPLPPPGR